MSVPKKNKKGEEMTRYAFISHMEDYMKKLLTDPQKAEPDDFLKSFGLDGPVCLDILLKRNGDNDPESAIILRKERIVKGECPKGWVVALPREQYLLLEVGSEPEML